MILREYTIISPLLYNISHYSFSLPVANHAINFFLWWIKKCTFGIKKKMHFFFLNAHKVISEYLTNMDFITFTNDHLNF